MWLDRAKAPAPALADRLRRLWRAPREAGLELRRSLPDPIAERDFTLTAEVALREVNAREPDVSALEILARQLLRTESVASSRIEGLQLSHRRLARADFGLDEADVTAQSVLANIRAMEAAVRLGGQRRAFTPQRILELHRVLFSAFEDASAGKLRTEQNWIGGASSSPRDAEFVPPPPAYVPELLEDLARFIARDDLPPVVQAAIAHAQFETIHPFADGNGRVGRCLIHAILIRRGVTPRVVPPISLVLATDAKAYVRGLTNFRRDDLEGWIALFVAATRSAAEAAARFATQLKTLRAAWLAAAGPLRKHSAALRLIELLPSAPILDVAMVEALVGCSNQAARLAVLQLENAGVLSQLTVGRRNRAWEAPAVFALLDAFERHLATRRGGRTRLRPAPARPNK